MKTIRQVHNLRELKKFIYFVRELYQACPQYVFPIFSALKKELKKEVLREKNYQALLCYDGKKIVGRLMFTYDYHKQRQSRVCFFSFFDCVDDIEVAKHLFNAMEQQMQADGLSYAEGTFAPYDPDTRRGILVDGFEYDPILFTSYNYPYYQQLLHGCGYQKAFDTYGLKADICPETEEKLTTITRYVNRRLNVTISPIDMKNLDNEIKDIHDVLVQATTETLYQEAPSIDMISKVAKNLKFFINPDLVVIARNKTTNKAVGFCLVLPDFYQVFIRTKGKLNVFVLLNNKKYITRVRGLMQYVLEDYQDTGLIGAMFQSVYQHFATLGIIEFEAGTIMEENIKSLTAFDRFGGKVIKTFRIFGKDITS